MTHQKTKLKLGFVPLADCAPLVVAKECGFFAAEGLSVELSREASWANIRDKVAAGALHGAQMLATMPMSMSLGLAAVRSATIAPMALSLGGNTITVASWLAERLAAAGGPANAALKTVMDEERRAGRPPLTFAMVYPFSTHHYELRYWLAAGGVDPDQDLRLIVAPPQHMPAHLSSGNIAGFCVGEPWGSLAEKMGIGRIVARSNDVFASRIEKVFGVTRAFAESCPETLQALLRALIGAAAWCETYRDGAADFISQPSCVNVPLDVVEAALLAPGAMAFHDNAANFPWRSQAVWMLTQMRRWKHVGDRTDLRRVAEDAYRPDLYRLAALSLKLPIPLVDYKSEGSHAGPWLLEEATGPITMGPDLLMDGARFDPASSPSEEQGKNKEHRS